MRIHSDAFSNADDFMKPLFLHGWLAFLLCALAVLMHARAKADSTNRGVWCWGTPGPYGLDYIVGTNDLENATVAQFKLWGIKHVFGFYGTQLKTVPGQAALAAWNTLLNNNGIESQLLISDYSLGSGDNNIIIEMINFNTNWPSAAQFKAVHLDIEPWGSPTWETDNKYNDLVALANSYQKVRAELNTNGESNVSVYADQAVWLNNLTVINWPSVSVRDQWFSSNFTNLAGITLMAYEQPTYSRIVNAVSWQLTNYPNLVRVGIDAGVGQTWSNLDAFVTVAGQVEFYNKDSAGVDIYDFQSFEEIVPPVISFGQAPLLTQSGFNFMVQGPIGSNCVVQASTDLANWQLVANFSSKTWLTNLTDSTATNHPYRFYRVTP
jgi:hypothetical protein